MVFHTRTSIPSRKIQLIFLDYRQAPIFSVRGKKFNHPCLLLVALICTSYVNASGVAQPLLEDRESGVMVVAHRACWQHAPENSIQSVRNCIALGVDMVEIDVRRTRDAHLVLMHDETVDRTTDGTGKISDLTLREIKQYRLKANIGGAGAKLTDERVPLLEEILKVAKSKILINLDIKEDIYHEALQFIKQFTMQNEVLIKMAVLPGDQRLDTAAFIGTTHFMPIIRQCRDDKPELICSRQLSDVVPHYVKYKPIAYEIVYQSDDYISDSIDEIKNQNSRLWVNTLAEHHAAGHTDNKAIVDPDAHWGLLIKQGVNMIQTDRPRVLIQYLKETGLR